MQQLFTTDTSDAGGMFHGVLHPPTPNRKPVLASLAVHGAVIAVLATLRVPAPMERAKPDLPNAPVHLTLQLPHVRSQPRPRAKSPSRPFMPATATVGPARAPVLDVPPLEAPPKIEATVTVLPNPAGMLALLPEPLKLPRLTVPVRFDAPATTQQSVSTIKNGNIATPVGAFRAPRDADRLGHGGNGILDGGFAEPHKPPHVSNEQRLVATSTGPAFVGARIIDTPQPAYTDQARNARVQGSVLVSIILTADGRIIVERVVHSLGYGLDETALAAIRHIRFLPARQGNAPVDQTLVVEAVFRLATQSLQLVTNN